MNNPEPLTNEETVRELVERVRRGTAYRSIHEDVLRRIAASELSKGRSLKDTVKAVRSRLHQAGGAYLDRPVDYPRLSAELGCLPRDPDDPELRAFCRRAMELHSSTRERLPLLDTFFAQALAPITPVRSVLDLACGLNPLAIPWMPLAQGAPYFACDIYTDLLSFVGDFLAHLSVPGRSIACDLVSGPASMPGVHLALLLKSLPCLEQQDKQIGLRLLSAIPADHILVSFPGLSLGGRNKGMVSNYSRHFEGLLNGSSWQAQCFEFPGELAYLLSQSRDNRNEVD